MPETPLTEEQMIGARIRQVRQQRDMSQAALAAKTGLSLPHISDIELGKVSMRISSFVRIVEALQVSADMLLLSDVPTVKQMHTSEFAELLSGCSAKEQMALIRIVREIKAVMHTQEE